MLIDWHPPTETVLYWALVKTMATDWKSGFRYSTVMTSVKVSSSHLKIVKLLGTLKRTAKPIELVSWMTSSTG
jgi:hypothetical protein